MKISPEQLQQKLALIDGLEQKSKGKQYTSDGKEMVPWENIELSEMDLELNRLNSKGEKKK